jgi:rRNA small subunit pseudouridine methyltransferase Nep1
MISMVFADAPVELVPTRLLSHPAVRKYAQRFNKGKNILLDDSYHHSAMRTLTHWERRGRPDIVHFCLLQVLGSPLCKEQKFAIHIHTTQERLITIAPQTRLPRNYSRFKGLMEQLLAEKGSKGGLISVRENIPFKKFIASLDCGDAVIGFSKRGEQTKLSDIFSGMDLGENLAIVIGAFPRGDFSKPVKESITKMVSIYPDSLDAWIVTSRILTQLEMLHDVF